VRRFFEVSTAKAAIAVGAVALNPGFRVFPMEYSIGEQNMRQMTNFSQKLDISESCA
jgi:hypothetical protein